MKNQFFLCCWSAVDLVNHFGMTPSQYTAAVNTRTNETDIVAYNHDSYVTLYVLPY